MLRTSCPISSETMNIAAASDNFKGLSLVDASHIWITCKKHEQSSDSASVEVASMFSENRGSLSGHPSGCKSELPDVALKILKS